MYKWLLEQLTLQSADQLASVVQFVGLLGAGVAFLIALAQYRRGERWKRKELVAKEIKEFFADPRVRNATLLIDWTSRRINIELVENLSLENCPRITKVFQTHALLPHTVKASVPTPAAEEIDDHLARTVGTYSLSEALIRDTYDAFLDGLERFANFVESRLVHAEEFRPYLQYWVNDLTRLDLPPSETTWQLSVLTYIAFYGFDGVTKLFLHLGHDIRPHGPIWNNCKQRAANRELVEALERSLSGAQQNDGEEHAE